MPSGQKGFTIIEVAVVLVIMGLLVGFGASLVGPLTIRAKRMETKDTLKAATESIIGFAASNGKIPTWGDNNPDATVDEFCEVAANRKDAFTMPLYYFFDIQLTSAGSICGRKTTNLTICRDPTCTNRVSDVAFMVVTGAENINPQTGIVTIGCPAGQTCIGAYDTGEPNIDNCTAAANCPNYDTAVARLNRPEEYDDLVKWVTLNELKIKIGCQGPPLRIVNNELPAGSAGLIYNITIYADGGVSPYNWSLITVPAPPPTWTIGSSTGILSSGTPPASGAYYVKVQVRDGNDPSGPNDNVAEKSFVITINP
jgi:prepilin-type N-terminal cleavage/methylation domain-containing protein